MTFMWRPLRDGEANSKYQLRGEANHRKQIERPAPSINNYGPPPGRVPRTQGFMLSYFPGLAQHSTQQWYSGLGGSAFLPPLNLAAPAMLGSRGVRSIAGYALAGTQSLSHNRVPSVRVPRVVT